MSNEKHFGKIQITFDIENWLWKSKFCNFWQSLLNWTQDLNFIGLVIGLEHKGRPCKMCDCVRQKLGYTKVQLNWLELMLFNPVRTCPRILALNASKRSRSLCYFKRWTEDLGRIRLQTFKKIEDIFTTFHCSLNINSMYLLK